jgi:hypothetical protein
MIQQNELITFLVGFGVAIYILANYRRLSSIRDSKILVASYFTLLTGWFLTILEGFMMPVLINGLEHLSYAVSSILMATWCMTAFRDKGDRR